MTSETFTQLLGDIGAKVGGQTYLMPDHSEVSFLVALEGETLTVTRVTKATLRSGIVFATCARGERFGVAVEDVRAIKG